LFREEEISEIKGAAIELTMSLPDDISWESIAYSVVLRAKIEQSLRSIETGKYMTHDEVVQEMDEWRRSFVQRIPSSKCEEFINEAVAT
jgi:hypothetical protein